MFRTNNFKIVGFGSWNIFQAASEKEGGQKGSLEAGGGRGHQVWVKNVLPLRLLCSQQADGTRVK